MASSGTTASTRRTRWRRTKSPSAGSSTASLGGPVVRDQTFFYANFEQLRQRSATVITIDPAIVPVINARLDAAGYGGPRIVTGKPSDVARHRERVSPARTTGSPALRSSSLRYSIYDVSSDNARNIGGLNDASRATGLSDRDQTLAASAVWSLSSRVLNEAARPGDPQPALGSSQRPGRPRREHRRNRQLGTATLSPTERDIDMYEVVDTVTRRARRSLVQGWRGLLSTTACGSTFPGALQGVYSFTEPRQLPGRKILDASSRRSATLRPRSTIPISASLVQDEWRATPAPGCQPRLRYDVQVLPSPVRTDSDNVAPRLGIAWDPQGDGKSVRARELRDLLQPRPVARPRPTPSKRDG